MARKIDIDQTEEERHKQNLERLAKLRPIDDTLMRELFRNNLPLAQLVLRIITGNNDLTLTSEKTQYDLQHLLDARSICLDVLATDSQGQQYDLEIQRADEGASPKRGRYHSSALDVETLKKMQDFDELKITYVIFITEHDVRGENRPIYSFERQDTKTGKPLGDGTNIVYVNGAYKNTSDESDLAKLIHDFTCVNAKDMYIDLMADKTRQYKETGKGVSHMCKVMEEAMFETELRTKYQLAIKALSKNKYSLSDISEMYDLPLETVKELANEYGPKSA